MTDSVLVTGANGFIGRALCRELQGANVRVRAGTRNEGAEVPGATESVALGDIGPETDWTRAIDGVEVVVHLAAVAHRIGAEGRAVDYARVNTGGTLSLALACARSRVRRIIFLSSIAVTGSAAAAPVSAASPVAPDSPYGASKRDAELALAQALTGTSCDYCIVRPPLVYGPGNPGNMARLLRLAELGFPLPLGGITNRRSFCFVGNLTSLIGRTLDSSAASRQTFLVADREIVSTTELIALIGEIGHRRVPLFHLPPAVLRALALGGDLAGRVSGRSLGLDSYSLDRLLGSLEVDAHATSDALGWQPPFSLREGLRRTLAPA